VRRCLDEGDKSEGTMGTTEIQSLERAFDVMDCFQDSQPELGVREIARQLGLHPSTVGRILTTLHSLGVLTQNKETRLYRMGPKVLKWSSVYTRNLDLQTGARPFMEDLQRLTEETISLDIPNGATRICIERIVSHHNLRWVKQLGEVMPFYASASGRVLLSLLPSEERDEILKHMKFERLTPHTTTNPVQFREELELTKRRGYAVSESERVEGVCCVAAPIFGTAGGILGALTVSGPSTRFSEDRIRDHARLLIKTTSEISQAMGYVPRGQDEELPRPTASHLELHA
jgi:DNA-binding IclR family transcriptional regulator